MVKHIYLEDGNRWILSIEPGYCTNTVSFSKGYLENGELIKTIDFSIWDDISFHGYINSCEYPDVIEYEFNVSDPIYFCLLELLGDSDTFIIDDDDSCERMVKFMTINREETTIKICFTNLKNERFLHNKYGAFIKNIGPDGRSKIEDIKVKYRIVDFFRNCEKVLLEDYHQISFFEYLEVLRIKDVEDSKLKRVREK